MAAALNRIETAAPDLTDLAVSTQIAEKRIVHRAVRVVPEEASLIEVLERILDGCIGFEPSIRLLLATNDLSAAKSRITSFPDRRSKPFIVPKNPVNSR